MSLINEALKKAQKQRQEAAGTPPATPVEPPPPIVPPQAPPASPAGPEPDPAPVRQMRRKNASGGGMKYAVGGAGFVVLLGLGWWMLSGDENGGAEVASAPESATPVETRPAPVVTESQLSDDLPKADEEVVTAVNPPASNQAPVTVVFEAPKTVAPAATVTELTESPVVPTSVQEPEPIQQPVRTVPAATTPVADERPVQAPPAVTVAASPTTFTRPESVVEQPPAAQPTTQPVVSSPTSSAPATVTILTDGDVPPATVAASSAAQAQPVILSYSETAKVTGVRASATDPKVLMNNRVYRLNDIVDSGLQLKITAISSRELQFTDSRGYVYTKVF